MALRDETSEHKRVCDLVRLTQATKACILACSGLPSQH
jgi:hypothetical protein